MGFGAKSDPASSNCEQVALAPPSGALFTVKINRASFSAFFSKTAQPTLTGSVSFERN